PMNGNSTPGRISGNRLRDFSTTAVNVETSNSLIDSTRTRVVVSCVATREISAALLSPYRDGGADSSALIITAISADEAPLKLRGVISMFSNLPICTFDV